MGSTDPVTRKLVDIFTDGACSGNPGPGGWGALLRFGDAERELSGCEPVTTNNRMELKAVIEALSVLKSPCAVNLHTDSQYVQKGMSEWLPRWRAQDFRAKGGEFRPNHELWRALDQLARRHEVRWLWVRGHAGHTENERVDRLARRALKGCAGGGAAGNPPEALGDGRP